MPARSAVSRSAPGRRGRRDDRHAVGAGQRLRAAEPHERAGDRHAAAVVVVAAHGHAQRRAGRDRRALGPRLERPLAARRRGPARTRTTAAAGRARSRRPVPNGPTGRRRRSSRRGGRPCRPSRAAAARGRGRPASRTARPRRPASGRRSRSRAAAAAAASRRARTAASRARPRSGARRPARERARSLTGAASRSTRVLADHHQLDARGARPRRSGEGERRARAASRAPPHHLHPEAHARGRRRG